MYLVFYKPFLLVNQALSKQYKHLILPKISANDFFSTFWRVVIKKKAAHQLYYFDTDVGGGGGGDYLGRRGVESLRRGEVLYPLLDHKHLSLILNDYDFQLKLIMVTFIRLINLRTISKKDKLIL